MDFDGFIRTKLWYQSPEIRVKENMKFSKATVHKSCNTVVEKIVKISLL
jgi:hypothetical protein